MSSLSLINATEEVHYAFHGQLSAQYFVGVATAAEREWGAEYDVDALWRLFLNTPADAFQPPEGGLLLAAVDQMVVGCCAFRNLTDDVAALDHLYVHPVQRRRGIGRLLLRGTIAGAADAEYTALRVAFPDFMRVAERVFHAAGFAEIDAYPEAGLAAEDTRRYRFMERAL